MLFSASIASINKFKYTAVVPYSIFYWNFFRNGNGFSSNLH